jgi:hypothetical protein
MSFGIGSYNNLSDSTFDSDMEIDFPKVTSASSPITISSCGYWGDLDEELTSLGSYEETPPQIDCFKYDFTNPKDIETDVISNFLALEPEPEFFFDTSDPNTFFLNPHATQIRQEKESNISLKKCVEGFGNDIEGFALLGTTFNWQQFFEFDAVESLWKPEALMAFLYKYGELCQKYFSQIKDHPEAIQVKIIDFFGFLEYFFKEQVYFLSLESVQQKVQGGFILDLYKPFLHITDLYWLFPRAIFSLLTDVRIASCSQFIFVWDLLLENQQIFVKSIKDVDMVSNALLSVQKIRMMNQAMIDRQNNVIKALKEILKEIEKTNT